MPILWARHIVNGKGKVSLDILVVVNTLLVLVLHTSKITSFNICHFDRLEVMAAQFGIQEAALVTVLANPVKGDVCFLCASTDGAECVWDEISNNIMGHGWATGIEYEDREQMHMSPLSLAEFHKACYYGCYWQYIFTVSSWCPGMGHICIPTCVEASIRRTFSSDRVFIGFQANNINE